MVRPVLFHCGLLIACTLLARPGWAQVVSARPDSVSVTVYRDTAVSSDIRDEDSTDGLVLVTEVRTIDVPAGTGKVSFRGVADGIVPQTAKLEGLPGDVVEYNFDFDLLTPGSLIARSIGAHVQLVRTNRADGSVSSQDAILRSGPSGVMLEIDGKLEAFNCSGAPERLVFDQIPPGLAEKPTLSMITRSPTAGRYRVRLTYLAVGMQWAANYVARIAPDGRSLDLTGWITLANHSGATFADAPTSVVAGRLSRVEGEDGAVSPTQAPVEPQCWPLAIDWFELSPSKNLAMPPMALPAPPPPMYARTAEMVVTGARIAKMTELGDYKLYTLPEPTTVAAHQTKQVQMLDQAGVRFERLYRYDLDPGNIDEAQERGAPSTVLLRLQNKPTSNLGKPLPAGTLEVMEPDARGGFVLAGEKKLDDIPVGLPFEVELGRAIDVVVAPRVVSILASGPKDNRRVRTVLEAVLVNHKPGPIRLQLRHQVTGQNFHIVDESSRHVMENGLPTWTVDLKAEARRIVSYTFDQAG